MELIAAPALALLLRERLEAGDVDGASRWLTEAVASLAATDAPEVPDEAIAHPESTGDAGWDTLLATAFAYAMLRNGGTPRGWMLEAPPLVPEWAWARDEAPNELLEQVRAETPPLLRAKGILTRARDWETW